jgi:hypothetical protein
MDYIRSLWDGDFFSTGRSYNVATQMCRCCVETPDYLAHMVTITQRHNTEARDKNDEGYALQGGATVSEGDHTELATSALRTGSNCAECVVPTHLEDLGVTGPWS